MLDKLFESIRIGQVELKNRIVLSPMALYYTPGGMVLRIFMLKERRVVLV
jgi:2,4-dienoyl-CoA reductase-like NADH-dependent reductase (Old Yellow Enzyme family)